MRASSPRTTWPFRVDDFLALGGFDPTYRTSEDRDLCARWVLSGRQLVYVPEAVVVHANPLTFSGFWHQNFTYGQGAFRFHRDQARRVGRRVAIEPSFYWSLARSACRESDSLRGSLVALWLLCVWHVANTVGFLHEWWRLRGQRDQGVDALHVAWSGRVGGIERLVEGYVRAASIRAGPRHLACLLDGRGPIGDALAADGFAHQLRLRGGWDVVGLWRFARLTQECPAASHGHVHARARALPRGPGRSATRDPDLPGVLGAGLQHRPEVPPSLSPAPAHDGALPRADRRRRASTPQPGRRSRGRSASSPTACPSPMPSQRPQARTASWSWAPSGGSNSRSASTSISRSSRHSAPGASSLRASSSAAARSRAG